MFRKLTKILTRSKNKPNAGTKPPNAGTKPPNALSDNKNNENNDFTAYNENGYQVNMDGNPIVPQNINPWQLIFGRKLEKKGKRRKKKNKKKNKTS
jgi:hypothetical protein